MHRITYNYNMANTNLLYKISIRPKTEEDTAWLRQHLINEWGGEPVLANKRSYYPTRLPGFLAILEGPKGKEIVGEVTYSVEKPDCEIVTLSSLREGLGIGTALFSYIETVARAEQCRKLHLITTSDNLNAIGFYQKRGMRIVGVLIDALDDIRRVKPHIGHIGMNNIPLKDALPLEKRLT